MRTICFCNTNIPWGGGEAWHLTAALSMARRGWQVLLLCHPKGELYARASRCKEIQTVPLALSRLSFLNPLTHARLRRFFYREGVQALILNLPADLKAAGCAARAAGVPRIIYRRGSALPVRNSLFNRYLYGTVLTRLIVNSEATKHSVLVNNRCLISPKRITILPNGIDIAAFDAALAQAPRPKWAAGNAAEPAQSFLTRPFIIGNAGRLNRQKGQHFLLYIGKLLQDAGLDFRLVIAGKGEREAELKTLAAKLDIAERTIFTGFMPDLSPFWIGIDLFVLSSLWEGFGYVLLEAMLAQKPIFAFAVSNIPELIKDGENGRIFSLPPEFSLNGTILPDAAPTTFSPLTEAAAPLSPGESWLSGMSAAILDLAAQPDERLRMGQAGRAFARSFSQDACMDALESLLREADLPQKMPASLL